MMAVTKRSEHSYCANDVVEMHCVHLDKPARDTGRRTNDGRAIVEIEGKARPTLVLGKIWRVQLSTAKAVKPADSNGSMVYRAEASLGYLVLRLRSRLPEDEKLAETFMQLPKDCLSDGRDTVVDLRPQSYPMTSMCETEKNERRRIDSWIVDAIRKELTLRRSAPQEWHPA